MFPSIFLNRYKDTQYGILSLIPGVKTEKPAVIRLFACSSALSIRTSKLYTWSNRDMSRCSLGKPTVRTGGTEQNVRWQQRPLFPKPAPVPADRSCSQNLPQQRQRIFPPPVHSSVAHIPNNSVQIENVLGRNDQPFFLSGKRY